MLIVLHGADTFRAQLKLNELVDAYRNKHGNLNNALSLEAEGLDFNELKNAIFAGSLFDDAKFVILKDLHKNNTLLDGFIENLLPKITREQQTVLLLFERVDIKKEKVFAPVLKMAAKTQEFEELSNTAAANWLVGQFPNLTKEAAVKLAKICGPDTARAFNEARKLNSFAAGRAPSQKDFKLLDITDEESHVFKVLDAVFSKRAGDAMLQLNLLWRAGEPPERVFAMLERQLEIVVFIKEQSEMGVSPVSMAKILGLHPYVVKKALPAADNFSWPRLRELYSRVCALDLKAKKGEVEPAFACELLSIAVAS